LRSVQEDGQPKGDGWSLPSHYTVITANDQSLLFSFQNAAWDIYYNVFKRISNQLRQMSVLDLNYISPLLSKARNLEVSVPGTYDPSSPLVTIASFHPHLQVIMSKQRPRKIYMRGSDGKEYVFLLKGHEDPRQDERVMQLFGLVNSLILREAETTRRNLTIQRLGRKKN
jgi:serine/threonine-protein kinase mTOR